MKHKALIIDDNRGDIELLKLYLLEEGWEHQVLWAKSGEEGLEIVCKERPEIVFLDINMPGLDGLEVCRRLRSLGATKTYIIIISGSKDPNVETQAKEFGADDFCHKQPGAIFKKLQHYYQITKKTL